MSGRRGGFVVEQRWGWWGWLLAPRPAVSSAQLDQWFEGTDTSPWPLINDAAELKSRGLVNVITPDAAVTLIKGRLADVPVEMFTMMLSPPGITLSKVEENLELFAKKVMPHFR